MAVLIFCFSFATTSHCATAKGFRELPPVLEGVDWKKTPAYVVKFPKFGESHVWVGRIEDVRLIQQPGKVEIDFFCKHLSFVQLTADSIAVRPILVKNESDGHFLISLIIETDMQEAEKIRESHMREPTYLLAGGSLDSIVELKGEKVPFLHAHRMETGKNLVKFVQQPSQYDGGIVYGPKAAFKICAPKEWVLDNVSGLSMGLHCVLYPKNYTWLSTPVLMYAKIASPEYTEKEKFIAFAIGKMREETETFKFKLLGDRPIDGEYTATIYEYSGGPYERYEKVGYIQVKDAVCYIVFSAKNKKLYEKYNSELEKTIDSFKYMPVYINYKD